MNHKWITDGIVIESERTMETWEMVQVKAWYRSQCDAPTGSGVFSDGSGWFVREVEQCCPEHSVRRRARSEGALTGTV